MHQKAVEVSANISSDRLFVRFFQARGGKFHEHCGVIGAFSLAGFNIVPMVVRGLQALQHRGQEAWGIAIPDRPPFKRIGIVPQSIHREPAVITKLSGSVGIGHVRYSTTGKSILENAHPLQIGRLKNNGFYIAHNGTVEREPLFKVLGQSGHSFASGVTDTELMGLGLYKKLSEGKSWVEALEALNPHLNGSFSTVVLTSKGELVGVRDERGFRPLCLGWHEETSSFIIASESCALDAIDAVLKRDVQPGEIVRIDAKGPVAERFSFQEKHAHCPFEYTYFAHPTSYIEGINVYSARKKIGCVLAEKYPLEADIVVPVPDSARPAALGYSERSGIPFEESLMKDRYRTKGSWRSFIEPEKREELISNIAVVKDAVEGKSIVILDDSIVRGTSSRIIVGKKLRAAKKVSLLLTFPPIVYPCFAGIDFPTQKELLAYRICGTTKNLGNINEMMAKHIGVSFLGYNDMEGLSKGVGIPECELCLSCTTGDYSCLKWKPKFKIREEMKF